MTNSRWNRASVPSGANGVRGHLFNTLPFFPSHRTDPYVKVSLLCDGRRLKKKKTTIKKNTLNPVYNEAIIFDIPPENMDQVSLLISVMDYDR